MHPPENIAVVTNVRTVVIAQSPEVTRFLLRTQDSAVNLRLPSAVCYQNQLNGGWENAHYQN